MAQMKPASSAYYPELTPGRLIGISIPPTLGLDRTVKVGQRMTTPIGRRSLARPSTRLRSTGNRLGAQSPAARNTVGRGSWLCLTLA
jgi:hypothetical protein